VNGGTDMEKIQKTADHLVERFGTTSPFELCDFLRIPVFMFDLPESVRGLSLQKVDGSPLILLNQTLGEWEKRYCCAHELGHELLHKGLNAQAIADRTNLCVPRLEKEADYFAACLLIDPSLPEWSESYNPLTLQQIACLSGLPEKIVVLWHDSSGKK
jgi:Zn-dependent peptidase ImmA (M78 family)